MADLLPNLEMTDPHARAGSPQDRRDNSKHTNNSEGKPHIHSLPGVSIDAYISVHRCERQASHKPSRSHHTQGALEWCAHKPWQRWENLYRSGHRPTFTGTYSQSLRQLQAGANCISFIKQILKRTNTSPGLQKLRAQGTDPYMSQSLLEATPDKKHSGESPRDLTASLKSDKK